MSELTYKQDMFCREFLIDLNATAAAIRAGYSEKNANRIASENLSKLDIQNKIAELMQQRMNDLGIDSNYVLNRLVEIDNLDIADILNDKGDIKPISQWSKAWRTSVNAIDVSVLNTGDIEAFLKKVKMPDKLKNLELLGKHIDVQAFKEKVDTNLSLSPFLDLMKDATAEEGIENNNN